MRPAGVEPATRGLEGHLSFLGGRVARWRSGPSAGERRRAPGPGAVAAFDDPPEGTLEFVNPAGADASRATFTASSGACKEARRPSSQ